MPVHDRVLQVKSFEVCDCGGFDFLWKSKMSTQLRNLPNVELHQEVFLFDIQEGNTIRGAWLHYTHQRLS